MRQLLCGAAAAALASAALASVAWADEAEIMSHFDAYNAAMEKLDYPVAEREGEAAWRAAEETWGGVADTGVLAFNVARLRLIADRRTEALEPARRVAELVEQGALPSVTPEEAALYVRLAEFDSANADRGAIRDLVDALEAFTSTDFASTRISWLGWSYATEAYRTRERWDEALNAAERAMGYMDKDPTVLPIVRAAVGVAAADASYNADRVKDGLAATHRAIAAYPAQPAEQPLDPMLAGLVVWQQGLSQLYGMQNRGAAYMPDDPALLDPAWDNDRYASNRGCTLEWVEQPMPAPQFGGRGQQDAGIGAVFEYYLEEDGSIGRVDYQGAVQGTHPFEATLRSWRAKAPASEACRGPWLHVTAFLPPRMQGGRR
jgi:tetratricopeptide (TPR) repeat protein